MKRDVDYYEMCAQNAINQAADSNSRLAEIWLATGQVFATLAVAAAIEDGEAR